MFSVLAACDDAAKRYSLGGTVSGLDGTLALSNGSEVVLVDEDGTFSFPSGLRSGASYAVVVMVQPDGQVCTVEGGIGQIGKNDVKEVAVTCRSDEARLASLTLAAPSEELAPAFDPEVTEYDASAFLFDTSMTITASSASGRATITVQGTEVASGEPSPKLDLALGPNVVPVVVTAETGSTRTYEIRIHRGKPAFIKASNTGASDQFGMSVAVWGDTMAVGANLEDSSSVGINDDQANNGAGDSGAVYVYVRTTAGTWAQQAYLKASNTGSGDQFGFSVSLSGDTMVVGAPLEDSAATGVNGTQADNTSTNSGAAYVLVRSAGVWTQQAYLKASNTGADDRFGESVSISGDTIVVGARNESSAATGVNGTQADENAFQSGAAYVFVRSGTVWSQQAYLKASNTGGGNGASTPTVAGDQFGQAVGVSGDTVVVGAQLEDSSALGVDGNQADNGASNSGSAYVFIRSGTTWTQQAYLKASNTGSEDRFGLNVAVSGESVAIAATLEDSSSSGVNGLQGDNNTADSGAVYLFTRSGTAWSQQAYLKASHPGVSDQFGIGLSLSGDSLLVGAFIEDSGATGVNGNSADNSVADSGAAYLFLRDASGWKQKAYFKSWDPDPQDQFGRSVAVHSDTSVVSAFIEDSSSLGTSGNPNDNGAVSSGAVFVYR